MITVFSCTFPDGKVFIGRTKLGLPKFIENARKKAQKNPDNIFLWNLSKVNPSELKWANHGTFWSSLSASKAYLELINKHKSYDREYGYNYITKNGSGWSKKGLAVEKSSVSRLKSRMLKLSKSISDKKLKKKVESIIEELDRHYKNIKGLKQ